MTVTASSKALETPQQVLCIQYPVLFLDDKVKTIINFESKVNIIISVYIDKQGLPIKSTDIAIQKINNLALKINEIVSIMFLV